MQKHNAVQNARKGQFDNKNGVEIQNTQRLTNQTRREFIANSSKFALAGKL